jgi:Transposase DDE domain
VEIEPSALDVAAHHVNPAVCDSLSLRLNHNADDDKQALGRSRGGFSSKIVGVCDAAGRLVDFVLVPVQAHELAPSPLLLKRLLKTPAWTLADMACDAVEFRSTAQAMGAIPVVPSRRNASKPQACPAYIYCHRNLIERCWSRLKERQAIATRYDKTAISYAAGIAIAVTLDWFKYSR